MSGPFEDLRLPACHLFIVYEYPSTLNYEACLLDLALLYLCPPHGSPTNPISLSFSHPPSETHHRHLVHPHGWQSARWLDNVNARRWAFKHQKKLKYDLVSIPSIHYARLNLPPNPSCCNHLEDSWGSQPRPPSRAERRTGNRNRSFARS